MAKINSDMIANLILFEDTNVNYLMATEIRNQLHEKGFTNKQIDKAKRVVKHKLEFMSKGGER